MRLDGKDNAQTVKKLDLDKLSVVKNPAQAPALAAIIKSISNSGKEDVNIIKQSFMEALQEITLDEQMDALMDNMWNLSWALRKSINATIHDENITNKKEVIQNNISGFATSMGNLVTNSSIIKTEENSMKAEEIQKLLKEALDPINAQLGFAQSVIKMDSETRTYFDTLSSEKQKEFVAKSTEEQTTIVKSVHDKANEIAKSAADDEQIIMHGRTIVKSVVGPDVFHVLKAQQEEIEKGQTSLIKEREAREIMEFTKQAEGLYPNLPGKAILKGKAMKTISGLDSEVRETITSMLKAGNEGIELSKTFSEIGDSTIPINGDVSAVAKLNKMAEDKAASDKITFSKAYTAVLKTKEGMDLYEESIKK